MATVFIPPQMRDLSEGNERMVVEGGTLRKVIAELDARFPGMAARLIQGETLAPGLAVSIDGELSTLGLRAKIAPESEVHIVAAIGGG